MARIEKDMSRLGTIQEVRAVDNAVNLISCFANRFDVKGNAEIVPVDSRNMQRQLSFRLEGPHAKQVVHGVKDFFESDARIRDAFVTPSHAEQVSNTTTFKIDHQKINSLTNDELSSVYKQAVAKAKELVVMPEMEASKWERRAIEEANAARKNNQGI